MIWNNKYIILVLMGLLSPVAILCQLSPGELTEAHQMLEGMANCTQCHDLGNKVPDQKCMECHDEITSLINANRGFHASENVANQTCVDCHSEHHGKRFEISRFDQDLFDHNLTGYQLEGIHEIIDCRRCHQPDYISDADLKIRKNTFLGLEEACVSCHQDFHQGTLNEDCSSCHNFQDFRPAPGFEHDALDFQLLGAHQDVDCIACHPIYAKNGMDYQQFSDIPFSDCIACHNDPHGQRIVGRCTQCHEESSFESLSDLQSFNHKTTDFELKGSHRQVSCFECHDSELNVARIFSDFEGVRESACVTCHADVHEGRFGVDCASCHSEESFLVLNSTALDSFDHGLTDYPLLGKHINVDCGLCHNTGSYSNPIDHSECKNCHEDYHRGQFMNDHYAPDCAECHIVTENFDYTLYGIAEHESSQFPLEGAHIATPCFACHVSEEEEWAFRSIGKECVDCHENIHLDKISDAFFPEQSCTSCHENDAWDLVSFDHDLTQWPLEGGHSLVSCRACHFENVVGIVEPVQKFIGLSTVCNDCHDNPHGTQFQVDGITNCTRCHQNENWSPDLFNHDVTEFPLDGRHAEIKCTECHHRSKSEGEKMTIYKIEKFACIDCHS